MTWSVQRIGLLEGITRFILMFHKNNMHENVSEDEGRCDVDRWRDPNGFARYLNKFGRGIGTTKSCSILLFIIFVVCFM